MKEKGRASVRYPSLRLPLDLTRSRVVAAGFAAGAAFLACPNAAGASASSAIALMPATYRMVRLLDVWSLRPLPPRAGSTTKRCAMNPQMMKPTAITSVPPITASTPEAKIA